MLSLSVVMKRNPLKLLALSSKAYVCYIKMVALSIRFRVQERIKWDYLEKIKVTENCQECEFALYFIKLTYTYVLTTHNVPLLWSDLPSGEV